MKSRWITLIVFVVGLLLFLTVFLPAAPDRRPNESIVRVSQLKSQVGLQARLDRNLIGDGSDDKLKITVSNGSQKPITSLHLSLTAPGFVLDQSQLVACHIGETTSDAKGNLPVHQSCSFEVKISPAARSGVYGIAATLSWNEADGTRSATLLLDPITIDRSFGAAAWSRAARRITGLLKDLTLPIIIVVLGYILANRQKEAETKRVEAENERQEARIKADKQRDEAGQVRQLLLTQVMELAEQHYLPFVNDSKQILSEAQRIRNNHPDAAHDKLFFHVLLLLKRMEVFRLTKGGLFFQTREGERAVAAAWYLLRFKMYAAMGEEKTAKTIKTVVVDWDYATYKSKFEELDDSWSPFQAWLKEPEMSTSPHGSFWQILGTIDAFQAVIAFEADRALSEHWYNEPGKLDFVLDEPTILYQREPAELYPARKTKVLAERLQASYQRAVKIVKLT